MKRIVLSAYQCGPGMGSVSQIGWEWVYRLSHQAEVTVLTHIRNKPAIESKADQIKPGTVIHYIDTEWLAGPLFRLAKKLFPHSEHGVFLIASLDFFLFDWLCVRLLKKEMKGGASWDAVQMVTPVTLAAPSRLHKLGIPFIRGPLNCGLNSPKGFETILRHEKEWVNRLRDWPRILDIFWGSSRNTDLFLVATEATLNKLPAAHRSRAVKLVENGIEPSMFPVIPMAEGPEQGKPLKLLFVGRLIALKGVDMLLQAVRRSLDKGVAIELTVVGDGPEMKPLRELAATLKLENHCRFTGALPAKGVAGEMAACNLFCLPSVRESGGAVILEAMATGRPVLTVNFGGPGELVDDGVGKALPLVNPERLIADMVATFDDYLANPQDWAKRGLTGCKRVEERFSWDSKITRLLQLMDEGQVPANLHLRHN